MVLVGFALGLMGLVLLSGCSTKSAVIKEDESQILRKRAVEYWAIMVNVNPKSAEKIYYEYEAPAFRDRVSFAEYVNRFRNLKYFEADVRGVEVEGEKAKVTVVTISQAILPMPAKRLKDTDADKWVKVKGTWYHFPKEWVIPE